MSAVELLPAVFLIAGVTLAVLVFLGYGLTALLLPPELAKEGVWWTPFVGYTFASVVYHALNVQFLDGRRSTLVLLVLGAIANIVAFKLHRRVQLPPLRVSGALFAVMTVIYLVGVAPLASVGALTAISRNYDLIDIYDSAAAYVLDYPVSQILTASPPNPLARLVAGPVPLSNGWGLMYVHALASLMTDRSPIETQTPVFSFLHSLLVPAAYIFLRRAVDQRRGIALVISAALGLQGMLLSMLFIGLGNHTAILALLPLIFTAAFLAIDRTNVRTAAFAGLMLSNIPLTYWAAFPFFVPPVLLYLVLAPTSPIVRRLRALSPRLQTILGR